jgi:DNA-binding NarL/FixJ family response regulator
MSEDSLTSDEFLDGVQTISVVLADDHPLILSGLETFLKSEKGFQVLATCTDGVETLTAVQKYLPDVLVLDLRMPKKDGIAVVKEIRELGLTVKTVILTADISDQQFIQCARLGVQGIFLKDMPARLLVQCLRKVHAGGQWLERQSCTKAMEALMRREEGLEELGRSLTNREIDIIKLVGQGLRNREIAEKLFISEGTVKIHLHNIFRKLDIQSRSLLIQYVLRKGLI